MSPKLQRTTASEVLRVLQRDGWTIVRQRGSHATLKHPERSGTVTVPRHGDTLPVGTINAILKQAGMTADDFRRLL